MKKSNLAILGGQPVRKKAFKSHPLFGKEEKKEVLSVLKSGQLSGFIANAGPAFLGGMKVRALESLVSRYFDIPYVVAMNSATSALHAALSALGIGPGDEVIVTPYTMAASASAILMQGAVPIFADIDERTFCFNPKKIEEKISSRSKALMVVHLFGQPAPMDEIMKIARTHKLSVVEDCAQSPGARYHDQFVGTLGDVGVFSLNQHKTITTGEGGFAVTKDKKLAVRLQLVRNHGEVVVDHLKMDFDPGPVLGFNYRMTELEAAVGVAQFKKLDKLNQHRIKLAEYLIEKLSDLPGITVPHRLSETSHVYFLLPLKYDEAITGIPRDIFIKALNAEGVPFGAGYVRPIYLDRAYRERRIYPYSSFPFEGTLPYKKGDCPTAERLHFKELITTSLCRYPLSLSDMADVAAVVKKVLECRNELQNARRLGKA